MFIPIHFTVTYVDWAENNVRYTADVRLIGVPLDSGKSSFTNLNANNFF